MKDKLKPCPFCGNQDIEIEYRYKEGCYMIYCCMCDAEMNVSGNECAPQRQDAIDQWNTRHVDLEGLEELIEIAKQSRYFILDARGSCDTFQGEMLLKRIDDYLNKNSQPPSGSI